jgi:hypothetical protein
MVLSSTVPASKAPAASPFAAPAPESSTAPIDIADVAPPAATSQFTARALASRPIAKPRPLLIRGKKTLKQLLPLLQSAQEALRLGDTDRALGLLDEHAKRFPTGVLAEERRAAHALAVCRKTAARAEAEAFLRDAPSSPLVESVRLACSVAELQSRVLCCASVGNASAAGIVHHGRMTML